MGKYVIVDLRQITNITESEVTVKVVSDTFDDPHKCSSEIKKRENNFYGSSGDLHMVEIENAEKVD
jgi:hypothetical protein